MRERSNFQESSSPYTIRIHAGCFYNASIICIASSTHLCSSPCMVGLLNHTLDSNFCIPENLGSLKNPFSLPVLCLTLRHLFLVSNFDASAFCRFISHRSFLVLLPLVLLIIFSFNSAYFFFYKLV